MAARLNFKRSDIEAALIDAERATNWRNPYGYGGTPSPGLLFVKDEGIYLMSNGTDTSARETVTYAEGYNPNADEDVWERSRAALGGDDFAERLDGVWIGKVLRATEGCEVLTLVVTAKDLRFEVDA